VGPVAGVPVLVPLGAVVLPDEEVPAPGVLFDPRVSLVPGRFPVFGSVLVPVAGAGLLVPGIGEVLVLGRVLVPGR